jgi:MazG family protein
MADPRRDPTKEERIRSVASPLDRVLALARVLREPDGCPWDREQTVETLTPYLQEETYEVVEAVAERDHGALREELGDLLFLVLLFGAAAEDSGWATIEETAEGVVEKLIRRHPHVFGAGPEVGSQGALRQWEEIKREEKTEGAPPEAIPSALGDRPPGLPALTTAFRISEKAGAVGFQWPDVQGALAKLEEEVGELRAEMASGGSPRDLEREMGDLLYSAVNVARYLRIDPERALRGTIAKFQRRFRYIEARLHEQGLSPERSRLDEMDALWNEAKAQGIE